MAGTSLALGLVSLSVNGANYFCLIKWDKPFLMFDIKSISVPAFRSLWSSSVSFFLIEISALLVFQTDRFLILQFSESVEVTKYTLASTIYLTFYSVYFLFLQPLWPAFGEAINRGDIDWTRRVFNRINFLSTIGMILLIAVVLMVGPYLIELWTGRSDVEPDKLLLAILGFYFLIRVFTDVHSIIMFSLDKQRELLWATFSHGFLNLVLGIVLGKEYGVHGIASASLLSFALSSGWWVPYKTRYYLRKLGEPIAK
jgi:O-antigen/teichoic acid export membrane protein